MTQTIGHFDLKITSVNADGSHVVGLFHNRTKDLPGRPGSTFSEERKAVGLYVASAPASIVGSNVRVVSAVVKDVSDCGLKFYDTYGISSLGPYESGWKYLELDPDTVWLDGSVPFRPLPVSAATRRKQAVGLVVPNSVWCKGRAMWVVREVAVEKFAGQERVRVWITDLSGKYGQAVYADSIVKSYRPVDGVTAS